MDTKVQYLGTAFLQISDTGSTHTTSNTPAKKRKISKKILCTFCMKGIK
jgi:hypothetical protein